ncbi:hypothetical protein Rs2_49240 [Raphanus sativus]|nr:hypothetical protein Rs2_49240 [Raphanus sativus]
MLSRTGNPYLSIITAAYSSILAIHQYTILASIDSAAVSSSPVCARFRAVRPEMARFLPNRSPQIIEPELDPSPTISKTTNSPGKVSPFSVHEIPIKRSLGVLLGLNRP